MTENKKTYVITQDEIKILCTLMIYHGIKLKENTSEQFLTEVKILGFLADFYKKEPQLVSNVIALLENALKDVKFDSSLISKIIQ